MTNLRTSSWLVPLAAFLVVVAFGVGLISMAAFGGTRRPGRRRR